MARGQANSGADGPAWLPALQPDQSLVETALPQQLPMTAGLEQFPVVKDEDPVGIDDGAEAMGHHEGGSAGPEAAQGALEPGLRLRVHRGGRLVQQEDRGLAGEGPGKGEDLPLPDRQRPPPFAQLVREPPGEALDQRVGPDGSQRPVQLRLREDKVAQEGFILSTCNRVEIYALVDGADMGQRLTRYLAGAHGLTWRELDPHLYRYQGADAVAHLFARSRPSRSGPAGPAS